MQPKRKGRSCWEDESTTDILARNRSLVMQILHGRNEVELGPMGREKWRARPRSYLFGVRTAAFKPQQRPDSHSSSESHGSSLSPGHPLLFNSVRSVSVRSAS